jgi:RNA polymerase sigma factor (TIGR02999 family)
MDAPAPDVTILLKKLTAGDNDASSELMAAVYNELRRLAASYMRRERPDHTLQATALVHEAYLKLVNQRTVDWQNRAHFYGVAAQLMRRILVDHARGRLRDKRGGGQKMVSLDEPLLADERQAGALLELDEALQRLAKLDPRQSRVVELRFFGGLTVEETAEVMGVSPKTVKRDWAVARAWLYGNVKADNADHATRLGDS